MRQIKLHVKFEGNMMNIKKIFNKTILTLGLCCLTNYALANDLLIVNKTQQDSTCRIIKKRSQKCTDSMEGGKGITRAGKSNTVSESNIRVACFPDVDNCLAYVYMNDHCNDPVVATIRFGVTSGIISEPVIVAGSGYNINTTIGSFQVEITESKNQPLTN